MSARRRTTLLVLAGAALSIVAAACAGGPTAPRSAPADAPQRAMALSATATLTSAKGLLWTLPATRATVTKMIGRGGGTLTLGGITMVVPAGAVASDVSFSITRVPGVIVAYDFQPHGTRFAVPVRLQLSTAGTVAKLLGTTARFEGAYFLDPSRLNQTTGTAAVSEFRPASVAADGSSVSYTVDHFSGWMVSTV